MRVQDGKHDDRRLFDSEVDCVRKPSEERPADSGSQIAILERPIPDAPIPRTKLVEDFEPQAGSLVLVHPNTASISASAAGSATSRYSVIQVSWTGDQRCRARARLGQGCSGIRRAAPRRVPGDSPGP